MAFSQWRQNIRIKHKKPAGKSDNIDCGRQKSENIISVDSIEPIKQGLVRDCSLVAAIDAVRRIRGRSSSLSSSSGVGFPFFSQNVVFSRKCSKCSVRFYAVRFRDSQMSTIPVEVDDIFPFSSDGTSEPLFSCICNKSLICHDDPNKESKDNNRRDFRGGKIDVDKDDDDDNNNNSLAVALIEKAYLFKFNNNSYSSALFSPLTCLRRLTGWIPWALPLERGMPTEILCLVAGKIAAGKCVACVGTGTTFPKSVKKKENTGNTPSAIGEGEMGVCEDDDDEDIVDASVELGTKSSRDLSGFLFSKKSGLFSNHCYALSAAVENEKKSSSSSSDKTPSEVSFILWNPWGDASPILTSAEMVAKYCSHLYVCWDPEGEST